jgi:hypothetical protein
MINIAGDLPPRWILVVVSIMGAFSAYYWTLQLLR